MFRQMEMFLQMESDVISEEGTTNPTDRMFGLPPELRPTGLCTVPLGLPNQVHVYHTKLTAHGIGNRKSGTTFGLAETIARNICESVPGASH